MVLKELLGEKLQNGKDTVDTATVLKDKKVVGLYFSAHWCGPCRQFTPMLADTYKKQAKENGFEVVFVSRDKDQNKFDEYYKTMPWLAIPFGSKIIEKLASKFRMQGIPYLVMVDSQGELIRTNGRAMIMSDPEFKKYPWQPSAAKECLKNLYKSSKGLDTKTEVGVDSLKGKTIGLYFSAHWCGPCRQFTPQLAKYYKKMTEDLKQPFEVVFCSADKDEKSYSSYYKDMPWMSIPFKYRDQFEALQERYGVRAYPSLVIVDQNFDVITTNGTSILTTDPEGKNFPWNTATIAPMSNPSGIDDQPSVIVYMDNEKDKKKVENYKKVLTTVAKLYPAKIDPMYKDFYPPIEKSHDCMFFYEDSVSRPGSMVRQLTRKTGEKGTFIMLLDLQDNGAYYNWDPKKTFNEENLKQFIKDCKDKNMKREQCARPQQ